MSETGDDFSLPTADFTPPVLSMIDILHMDVEQLKSALGAYGLAPKDKSKPSLQIQLIQATIPSESIASSSFATENKIDNDKDGETVNIDTETNSDDTMLNTVIKNQHVHESNEIETKLCEQQFKLKQLELEAEERKLRLKQEHELQLRKLEIEQQQFMQHSFIHTPPPTPIFRVDAAVKLVPKFDENDVESFLLTFERIAQLNSWPTDKYAPILQAHLSGKALKVFTELTTEQSRDYHTLKEALLLSYAVVPEVHRKRFRSMRKQYNETYSEFAFRLTQSFKRWLEGEASYTEISRMRETIKLEQFRENLDSDLAVWLIEQKPTSLTEAARLSDQYIAIRKNKKHDTVTKPYLQRTHNNTSFVQQSGTSTATSSTQVDTHYDNNEKQKLSQDTNKPNNDSKEDKPFKTSKNVVCFYCRKPGHTISNCAKRLAKEASKTSTPINLIARKQEIPMVEKPVANKNELILDIAIDPGYKDYCINVTLVKPDSSHRNITLLRDTGALQSLLSKETFSDNDYVETNEYRLIRGVSGQTLRVPLVEVTFVGEHVNGTFVLGLIDKLPEGVHGLMGNDMCDSDSCNILAVTRAQHRAAQQQIQQNADGTNHQTTQDNDVKDDSFDPCIAQLWHEIDVVNEDTLKMLQNADPVIKPLITRTLQQDSDSSKHTSTKCSDYFVKDDILMRSYLSRSSASGSEIHQIVVPSQLQEKVLYLAHDSPLAGHLGSAKTLSRILQHFYWPGINKTVKEYCRSCDVCQKIGKRDKKTVAPLQPIPLVSKPFSQIAIDIVGPLPKCTDTENRFILTVLDLCTHYPEAIALKRHTAKDVAQALITVFSRFGFPDEVISDLGTDFQSELMQIFMHEFNIKQIRTSPYHPMANGACERWNSTMKTMLSAVCDKYKDNWDVVLPWVLFAYREVPVATLGCSPFELLYGRSVSGPLALLKASWINDVDINLAKQNVIDFITDTREKIKQAVDLANTVAQQERIKAKTWYDKKARFKNYEVGDEVLILLPMVHKPLQAKYYGPYVIAEKLGPVDYVVHTPDRRKQRRVCHANLMKPYIRRLESANTDGNTTRSVLVSDAIDQQVALTETGETNTGNLPCELQSDVDQIKEEFADIFSDKPGKTHLCTHHIELVSGTKPIKCSPYRLNPEKVKYLKEEIAMLLKDKVIEETESSYASNVVLVPKPDKTLRLCTDYRKLNAITVPDPFPLPRIEDLIDRVGQAKYLTKIDMTRGYWQVPLDEESVPLSAFVTPFGHFAWRVMPFGLRNAPATFSRLVNKLLRGMDEFAAAYLDDILIFSNSWEEHLNHIRMVFQRIRQAGLTLNISKCVFGVAEVDYLGHHIGLGKVQPRENKVIALLNYPRPVNKKQLQSFLGLAGFYRKYIPHYSHITSVLTDLLKQGAKFKWSEEAEQTFLDIKSRLVSRPILRPPNFDIPFHLAVDSSNLATGAVLFQTHDGTEYPICYFSHKLDVHQKRYSTIEKEALGLVLAVRAFSVYFGSTPVKVYTDHNPLVFIQKMANYNQKLLRWCLELQQYNLEVVHRPGKDNFFADLLSRPTSSE